MSAAVDELLTTAEAAVALGCTPGNVRYMVHAGKLTPARRYPGALLFAPAEVARYAAWRDEQALRRNARLLAARRARCSTP